MSAAVTAETREQGACECGLAPRPEGTCGHVSAGASRGQSEVVGM